MRSRKDVQEISLGHEHLVSKVESLGYGTGQYLHTCLCGAVQGVEYCFESDWPISHPWAVPLRLRFKQWLRRVFS